MRGMGKLSVLLTVLVVLSVFKIDASLLTEYYVTPIKIIGCSANRSHNCLTLQEYAKQPDKHFTNNTIFYFEQGGHELSSSLKLENLHNFTFQGLPDSTFWVGMMSVSITWEKCRNIKVSSITFQLLGNFTYIIMFNQTQIALLHNISVMSSNDVSGFSSVICQQSEVVIRDCHFIGIQGSLGAAVLISESNATFKGNNIFIGNTASSGGSLYLLNSETILTGANYFVLNSSFKKILTANCSYSLNDDHPIRGSDGTIFSNSSTLIINTSYFANNFAQSTGGAISVVHGDIIVQGNTIFESNFALGGGAMHLNNVTSKLHGNISFVNNGDIGGDSELLKYWNNELQLMILSLFPDIVDKRLLNNLSFVGTINSKTCETANRLQGGAIQSADSSMTIFGNINFTNNTAFHGGAMYLAGTSRLILSPATNISFINNHANGNGGALYVKDSQCSIGSTLPIECFLSIDSTINILLNFSNNSANSTGSTLYGGQLNKCRLYYGTNYNRDECGNRVCNGYSDDALGVFMNISNISTIHYESVINISSQANQLKFCQGNNVLDNEIKDIKLHPGEEFNITVIAIGQAGFPVPTTVYTDNNEYTGNRYRLRSSNQSILKFNGSCTNITFQLLSGKENCHKLFKLYPDNPCQSLADGLHLRIDILACPIGFELSDRRCVCDNKLQNLTKRCTIRKFTKIFERTRNNFWISQTNDSNILIIHEYRCPLDYCRDASEPVNVSLSNPSSSSVQCDFNRTGTLCGQCRQTFGLALGSLHCIPCNNSHSALILFFALAGVALIAVIFLLRLTVSVGTLNGLLFYANIIQGNHQAFFPSLRATTKLKFFTIFISWLNFDLGIETCFYHDMDIYAYSWFQFLFPFYLLFLVGCIILACRYSRLVAKLFGQNPVAVLATLLLMSYSKILQASIVPLSWTHLIYYTGTPSNETRNIVWLYDASIYFFREPKHTVLGLFAISSLIMFVLPYILLLIFGHWLQSYSNWWILSWLNKLKPFMDAYHAPYKKHTRYWTGLLLLSRLGLFLTFAINANGSDTVNLVAVSSVTIVLLTIQKRVYEQWYKDFLESFFILNLGIFSVATFYFKEESKDADESQFIVSSTSIGIAFITFIGIIIYHVCLVFKSTSSVWKVHFLPFIQKSYRVFKSMSAEDEKKAEGKESTELHTMPTFTEVGVDLREPLIEPESTDSEARAAIY